jgi:branched-chain amino acid transport system ATP-binding protein
MMAEQLLIIKNLQTFIQQFHILQGVDLEVKSGEITVILGRNGAGKTTTLRSIMGLSPAREGTLLFKGKSLSGLPPYEIARRGIGYVPEGQEIFYDLTVEENLRVAMFKEDKNTLNRRDYCLDLFPDLKKFYQKKGGTLSGGQKQMLSVARALMNDNELLLIDEPSKGLAPIIVEKLTEALLEIKQQTTIVLVEQNFAMASSLGDTYYILDDGQTVASGTMKQLKHDQELQQKFLGIAT